MIIAGPSARVWILLIKRIQQFPEVPEYWEMILIYCTCLACAIEINQSWESVCEQKAIVSAVRQTHPVSCTFKKRLSPGVCRAGSSRSSLCPCIYRKQPDYRCTVAAHHTISEASKVEKAEQSVNPAPQISKTSRSYREGT